MNFIWFNFIWWRSQSPRLKLKLSLKRNHSLLPLLNISWSLLTQSLVANYLIFDLKTHSSRRLESCHPSRRKHLPRLLLLLLLDSRTMNRSMLLRFISLLTLKTSIQSELCLALQVRVRTLQSNWASECSGPIPDRCLDSRNTQMSEESIKSQKNQNGRNYWKKMNSKLFLEIHLCHECLLVHQHGMKIVCEIAAAKRGRFHLE